MTTYKKIRTPIRYSVEALRLKTHTYASETTADVSLYFRWLEHDCFASSSRKRTDFVYDDQRMMYVNSQEICWDVTINCEILAVEGFNPINGKSFFKVDFEPVVVIPGMGLSLQPGELTINREMVKDLNLPDNYVIQEDPDPVDWQKQLVQTKTKTRRRRL